MLHLETVLEISDQGNSSCLDTRLADFPCFTKCMSFCGTINLLNCFSAYATVIISYQILS